MVGWVWRCQRLAVLAQPSRSQVRSRVFSVVGPHGGSSKSSSSKRLPTLPARAPGPPPAPRPAAGAVPQRWPPGCCSPARASCRMRCAACAPRCRRQQPARGGWLAGGAPRRGLLGSRACSRPACRACRGGKRGAAALLVSNRRGIWVQYRHLQLAAGDRGWRLQHSHKAGCQTRCGLRPGLCPTPPPSAAIPPAPPVGRGVRLLLVLLILCRPSCVALQASHAREVRRRLERAGGLLLRAFLAVVGGARVAAGSAGAGALGLAVRLGPAGWQAAAQGVTRCQQHVVAGYKQLSQCRHKQPA